MGADHLFVYGTLRRGSNNKFARLLAERGQFVSTARVPGRLYDLGQYPGAVRPNAADQWVQGEIHRAGSPQLLATLDEYEGEDFERAPVIAQLDDGGAVDCWIYWYTGAVAGRLIPSGDWLRR